MVCAARHPEKVVGARRLFLPQGGAERSKLPEERTVCRRLPEVDGYREGLLGRAGLCGTSARYAEARPRLRRGRQGNGTGSARSAGEGLAESVQGRGQD